MSAVRKPVCPPVHIGAPGLTPSLVCVFLIFLFSALCPGYAEAVSLSVKVQGVEEEMLQAVLFCLSMERQKSHPYLNDSLVRRLHAQAPEEISVALRAFGFYRPGIDSRLARTIHEVLFRSGGVAESFACAEY